MTRPFYGLIFLLPLLLSCFSRAEPEKHFIPDGYTGSIVIIYGDSAGQEANYENGFRVYKIPASGVLRTKFEHPKGWIADDKRQFFYYDSGRITPIKVIHEIQNHPIDEKDETVYVFSFEESVGTTRYLVGKLHDRERFILQLRTRIDSLFPPQIIQ